MNYSLIQKLVDQNVLENNPSCKGNSFFIIAKKNSEDRMNPEVLTSQTPMPQNQNYSTLHRFVRKKTH